jgi:hypothetical protein
MDTYVINEFHKKLAMYQSTGAKARFMKTKKNYQKYMLSLEKDFLYHEKMFWQDYYKNCPEDPLPPPPKPSKKKLVFVTINFDNKNISDISYHKELLRKILTWKCIKSAHAAFEFRSDTIEDHYGCHLHIVCCGETKYIKQNFKRLKGKFIQINEKYKTLRVYPMSLYQDKIDYISGKTFDEEKNSKKEKDELYRKKLLMENIYQK